MCVCGYAVQHIHMNIVIVLGARTPNDMRRIGQSPQQSVYIETRT